VGFSAQDTDVREIFVDGVAQGEWNWNADPKPFIFAEDALQPGQRTVLQAAYGDAYAPNRAAIEEQARVRAYAKPLLMALLMSVLELKTGALLNFGVPAAWDGPDRALLESGLRHIRTHAALASEPDRLVFLRTMIEVVKRGLHLFHHGEIVNQAYIPISAGPFQQLAGVPASTGLRQAAIAVSLLGCGGVDGSWSIKTGPAGGARCEGTAAQAAERTVENARAGIERGRRICDSHASGIVQMNANGFRAGHLHDCLGQLFNLLRAGIANRVGDGHEINAGLQAFLHQFDHFVWIDRSGNRASERHRYRSVDNRLV